MADTAINITEGSGTTIDTRTESTNGNHRQVVVIGDPATNAGVAPVDATTGLAVNVTNSSLTVAAHAVTNAGTFAVQESGAALTALQLIDDPVIATGSATPAKAMLAGGTDGTNARALKTDSSGELQVDVLTVPALAAGTNLIGRVSSSDETSTLYNGTTALTPKYVIIDNATSGNNTILAAVTGKKIRVLSCFMVAAAAVTVRFESGADGTALTGQMNLAANGGFVLPYNPLGWFETASNTLLNLELSGATSVDGSLVYVEV